MTAQTEPTEHCTHIPCKELMQHAAKIGSLERTVRGVPGEGNPGLLGELARVRKAMWVLVAMTATAAIPGFETIWLKLF